MISLKNIQTEIDASFLYKVLGDHEDDANVASVFHQMSEIEHGHALAFMKKNNLDPTKPFPPSTQAKILNLRGRPTMPAAHFPIPLMLRFLKTY